MTDDERAYIEDLLRTMGQMNHTFDDKSIMTMPVVARRELIHRGWWEIVSLLDKPGEKKGE